MKLRIAAILILAFGASSAAEPLQCNVGPIVKNIGGEGNGSKEYSAAAFDEIKKMTAAQFDELVQATKKVVEEN